MVGVGWGGGGGARAATAEGGVRYLSVCSACAHHHHHHRPPTHLERRFLPISGLCDRPARSGWLQLGSGH